jgi:hypothetical protein
MTEQPPVVPENPTDSGSGQPPTPTEQQEAETNQQVQTQTPLSASDHELYAQALYGQPAFVVHAVFSSGKLDSHGTMYSQAQVQSAIDEMMQEPDKTFAEAEQ